MINNKFAEISGLKLNKKKTKAIWIGSQKKNKTRPLATDLTNKPTKTLGIYTLYNHNKNMTKTFSSKFKNGNKTKSLAVFGPHPYGMNLIGKSIRDF